MAVLLHKIKRRFTNNGAAMTGTVRVTEAGGNSAVRIYQDVNGANKWPSNALALDADGTFEAYVRPGRQYRLTVVDNAGNIQTYEDNITPVGDLVDTAKAVDNPGYTAIAYAATITPVASEKHTTVVVGTLTNNITIANPTKAAAGKTITFAFTQDGTGSRTITWGSAFAATTNGTGTAGQKGATSFIYDGSKWVQIGGAIAFR